MVTIHDVAREANVSPATVSRVINNSLVVSSTKRQRVLEAIEKLGYVLPAHISTGGKLVLVISDVSNADFSNALYQSLSEYGYQMFMFYFCEGQNTGADLLNFLKRMPPSQIAGVVLHNFIRPVEQELFKVLDEFPIVQIRCDQPFSQSISIKIDNTQAVYEATEHLLSQGCRRIVCYTSDRTRKMLPVNQQQINGCRLALMDHGIPVEDGLIVESDFTVEGCYESTVQLLRSGEVLPDGFICPQDAMAMGCLRALQDFGVKVPEQACVVSMAGNWIGAFTRPSVTAMRYPEDLVAQEAARQLHLLICEPAKGAQSVYIPFKFVFRESTDRKQID